MSSTDDELREHLVDAEHQRWADWQHLTARLAEVEAERDAAKQELARWESGQRIKGLPQIAEVPDGLQIAAALIRAQGTEGGEEHDELLRDAGVRLRDLADAARHLLAESVVLRGERDEAIAAVQRLHTSRLFLDLERANATVEAWRPVVEAAIAWRDQMSGSVLGVHEAPLVAAVDALPSTPPTTEVGWYVMHDHGYGVRHLHSTAQGHSGDRDNPRANDHTGVTVLPTLDAARSTPPTATGGTDA
jgi:hypothetical protein